MSPAHRLLLKWARTLHVYLTLFGFGLLLFFAVTGFMLNHENWFSPREPYVSTTTGVLPVALLSPRQDLAIVELLRKDFGVRGQVVPRNEDSADLVSEAQDSNDKEVIEVVFKSPGSEVLATIQKDDGQTTVVSSTRGVMGILLDLHRGKDSGLVWSILIDAVSILFVIVAFTGLVLWSSLRSRGKWGMFLLIVGFIVGIGVYFKYVPH